MVNQIKKTQDVIRENGNILKQIKKEGIITDEQKKKLMEVMSSEELDEFLAKKKEKTTKNIEQTRSGWLQSEGFKETLKTRKEDIALIKQVAKKMDVSFEEAYNILHGGDELKKKVSDKKESKETNNSAKLQKEILAKPNMTAHHKAWLQKKTDELVKNEDKAGLEQLNKGINFTEKGGLIINTPSGPLKFAPKQATFDDVKNIDGIKENKNVWTENEATNKKGLRANYEASKKMRNAGKKICSDKQYLVAANAFPGGDELAVSNYSTKAKDFFDLLGVDQYGLRLPNGTWNNGHRYLWSASDSGDDAYTMDCYDAKGRLSQANGLYGFGVWFLED